MTVKWKRLNHPGGFVRLALTRFEASDNKEEFDNNIIKYSCFESNCHESKASKTLGKLNGLGSPTCHTKFKIPEDLKDGRYTLQWTWFSGGVYYADPKASFPNYVSCADFEIRGGTKMIVGDEQVERRERMVEFQGGDAANPKLQKCRYWGYNTVHDCPLGAHNKTCGYEGMKNGKPKEFENLI